jgi:hypothetical protein
MLAGIKRDTLYNAKAHTYRSHILSIEYIILAD